MKIIFPKQKDGIVIPRSTKKGIKREVKRQLVQQLGRHVSTLQEIAVKDSINPKLNGFAVYTETKGHDPQEIFHEIRWGTNYFFGIVEMVHSRKKFFFLADIQNPLPIGNEKILLGGINEIKVYIKNHQLC